MDEKRTLENWGILHRGTNHPPLWWRDKAMGYSEDIADAGLFTEGRATKQAGPRCCGALPADEAVPPEKMVEQLEEAIAKADERLEKLCRLREQIGGHRSRGNWSTWELVQRAVTWPVIKGGRGLRWSHVGNAFGLGSTSAGKLCERFGLDPDELIGTDDEDPNE